MPSHNNPSVAAILAARANALNASSPGLFDIEVHWVLTFHPEHSVTRKSERALDRVMNLNLFRMTFSTDAESAQLERE